jgi:hypothetical protein
MVVKLISVKSEAPDLKVYKLNYRSEFYFQIFTKSKYVPPSILRLLQEIWEIW